MRYRARFGCFKSASGQLIESRVEDKKEIHIFTSIEHLHIKETKNGHIEIVKKECIEDWNKRQEDENYRAYDQ